MSRKLIIIIKKSYSRVYNKTDGDFFFVAGEMMMSLLWYYRPEHTKQGRQKEDMPDELFASKHRDVNSVACIDDRCFVLTFNEYCRSVFPAKKIYTN